MNTARRKPDKKPERLTNEMYRIVKLYGSIFFISDLHSIDKCVEKYLRDCKRT